MKTGYMIKQFIGMSLFFVVIFISAGKLNYLPGWIYAIVGLIMFILNFTVLRIDQELVSERSKPGTGTKAWDKKLMVISFIMMGLLCVAGGLDSGRYHWSPDNDRSFLITGSILTFIGQLLFLIAKKQNKFFSSIVRIQKERNHSVVNSGLYKIIRHPAYAGSILQLIGFPFLFGSLWSIIPAAILIILFLIRTKLEDETLNNELKGYKEYSVETRYKLVPYIW